jgi:BMFP domain-containing protein YqiC
MGVIFQSGMAIGAVPGYSNYGIPRSWLLAIENFGLTSADLEKTFHAILQSALGKLDLVTREEFEVQKLVLAKTRVNLELLEKRVAEMEQSFSDSKPN